MHFLFSQVHLVSGADDGGRSEVFPVNNNHGNAFDFVSGLHFHGLVAHPVLLVLCCQLLFILFGMVLDIVPIIMILVPVMIPLVNAAGVNLEYFGILSIITMTFGLITPPVGTVLYVGSGISRISIVEAVRGAFPFMMVEVAVIIALSIFPQIVLVPLSIIM